MIFQVSDLKGNHFLDPLNDDLHNIESLYIKGDLYIKYFRYSNSLYTRTTQAMTNHTPIGEYHLRFFLKESFILQTQVLSVGQVDESCTRLTQENSIEDSVQDSLSYILKPHGPC